MTDTKVTGVFRENGKVAGVIAEHGKEQVKVKAGEGNNRGGGYWSIVRGAPPAWRGGTPTS